MARIVIPEVDKDAVIDTHQYEEFPVGYTNNKHKIGNTSIENPSDKENVKKLESIVQQSEKVLLKVSTVFPFDLFPDDIVIDKNKVSIIQRKFFGAEQVRIVPLDGIGDITVEAGPLFASLSMINTKFIFEPIVVEYLKKGDAMKVQQVVQGLTMAQEQHIDFSEVGSETLVSQAEKLGQIGKQHK